MTVVIHKKAYYTADQKQIGPVEVYDKNHQFVGIGVDKKLIIGRKEDGYFIEDGRDYRIRVALGDRLMFQEKKEGISCYVGYNEKAEVETRVGFLIWKEDFAEAYARTPVATQSKMKKIWRKIWECAEHQIAQG